MSIAKKKYNHIRLLSSISPLRKNNLGIETGESECVHPILKTNNKHMKLIISTAKAYFRGENGKELHRKVKSMIKTIGNSPK